MIETIVGLVVVYLVIAAIVFMFVPGIMKGLGMYDDNEDEDKLLSDVIKITLLWPLSLVIAIVIFLIFHLKEHLKNFMIELFNKD